MAERLIPDWFTGFLSFTSYLESPLLYRAWTAISVIAAALQRKTYSIWEKEVYPNMFIVLVGPPGLRKGTAMGPGEAILREIGIKLAADSLTRERLIRELNDVKTIDNDKLGNTFLHSSLTVFSGELIVFLGNKMNNMQMISDLTDWYDCKDQWSYKTKTQGEDNIFGIFVNLIGATTPDLIRTALPLEAGGGGLTSRIVFVYEDKLEKRIWNSFPSPAQKALRQMLVVDLQQISLLSGQFKHDDSFYSVYAPWYEQQDANLPFQDYRFSGYFERRATHIRKLSMIMCASRTDDMVITSQDFNNALALLTSTERKMQLTFVGVGRSATADISIRVLQYLAAEKRDVRVSELMQTFYRDMDKRTGQQVLDALVAMKMIQVEHCGGADMLIRLNTRASGEIARLING